MAQVEVKYIVAVVPGGPIGEKEGIDPIPDADKPIEGLLFDHEALLLIITGIVKSPLHIYWSSKEILVLIVKSTVNGYMQGSQQSIVKYVLPLIIVKESGTFGGNPGKS